MRKVNFHTIDNLTVPQPLLEKTLAIPSRAKHTDRRLPLAAAAVFILMIGAALIYGVFVAPTATIRLNSRESVVITLNSRGNVLSATGRPEMSGKSAGEAVAAITREMLDSGAIDRDENTLLIGCSGRLRRDEIAGFAASSFKEYGFDGCIVAMSAEDDPGSALIRSLTGCGAYPELKKLSVNDLALLLVDSGFDGKEITVTGAPSDSAYLGFDGALARAMEMTSFGGDELGDASVSYGVYHGRLIYLVRLNAGGKSEVYFINALSGATEEAIKAPVSEIEHAVEKALRTDSPDPKPTIPATDPVPPAVTQTPTDPEGDNPPYAIHTEAPSVLSPEGTEAPDQQPTTAESEAYRSVAVSLKELSFVVDTPPETALPVGFDTLFEGQYIGPRTDRQSGGTVAVITNLSQWQAFIGANSFDYTDQNGRALSFSPTADWFRTRYIIASACIVSDASYCTTVTALRAEGDHLYMENSFSYGKAQSGEFTCRTLSLYGVSRSDASPDSLLTVY